MPTEYSHGVTTVMTITTTYEPAPIRTQTSRCVWSAASPGHNSLEFEEPEVARRVPNAPSTRHTS